MSENKSFDHFNMLTKKQIIEYLKKEYFFHAPDESQVKFFLYSTLMSEYLKRQDERIKDKSSSVAAKKADELAVLANAETDIGKKLKILKERQKHVDVLMHWVGVDKKDQQEYKRIQKLIE